jgi:hypothetical protein
VIESDSLHLGYAVTSLCLLIFQYVLNSRQKWASPYVQYIKPSQIGLAYIFGSYMAGAIFLYFDISYFQTYLIIPETWAWTNFWLWFATMFLALIVTSDTRSWFVLPVSVNHNIFLKAIILSILTILLSRFLIIGLLMWIGILFYIIVNNIGLAKFLGFTFFSCIALVLLFYGSKRFLIFPLIIAVLYMSAVKRPVKLYLIFIAVAIFFLIVLMSVLRGYGGAEGVGALLSYFRSDLFLQMIGNNFEFVYFYFHGVNSTEMISNGSGYLFGETFAKGLFFGWNYLGINHGLRSSIDVYTNLFSADTRQNGGSFPVNIYAEFFMNFSFFVVFIFPVFFWLVDRVSGALMRAFGSLKGGYYNLVMLVPWVFWVRGSSVDLFVYYSVFGLLGAYIVLKIMSIKFRF